MLTARGPPHSPGLLHHGTRTNQAYRINLIPTWHLIRLEHQANMSCRYVNVDVVDGEDAGFLRSNLGPTPPRLHGPTCFINNPGLNDSPPGLQVSYTSMRFTYTASS